MNFADDGVARHAAEGSGEWPTSRSRSRCRTLKRRPSRCCASLGAKQFEDAYQHWLKQWKAYDAYNPDVEMNATVLMGEATTKLYAVLKEAGFDVLPHLALR
jgi:hypothetical protein